MKRSEMIRLISNWLLESAPETYNMQFSYGRQLAAEDLLAKIESAGMLPPMSPTDRYKDRLYAQAALEYFKWEPEDDKKGEK